MTDELTPERLREWGYQLELEGNPLGSGLQKYADAWDRDRREIERLRAERDCFRKELARIADCNSSSPSETREAVWIAREALAATEEKRDD